MSFWDKLIHACSEKEKNQLLSGVELRQSVLGKQHTKH